ncbi:equilibrative nucleoside transporter 1 [Scaptodrosophila lebanonensis]|uniref:Equilibrative nucleoside transporter 1 n=1 Tax=Drosophila lebanonensis TaxID=7225 RepID=A0A6J2U9N9_DROLE|nr:equilibrative nucleoside transporter 1 [Scaptodrosophila lebanonensis]XP_030383903.1 equilibrative nucleoside transporter 1 [Scaptodrosophila lebanonensis]
MSDPKLEKAPFISNQIPVKLNPSWESRLTQELHNKGSRVSNFFASLKPPKDKYKMVFFIFLLHGLGTLMPWNMFITAKDYFVEFKLDSNTTTASAGSSYAGNFLQYIGFASQIPNLLLNWFNIFVNLGGDLTKRIVYSILIEIVIFVITIVLAMLDSSEWPGIFFWITMICVVILNMANGIYQNTIYGMAASLPVKYTGAVVLGSNISGLFATVISIASRYLFDSKRTAAIYYFLTAMLILLVCFDTYFALPLNKFFRHYEMLSQNDESKKESSSNVKPPYWQIIKEAFPQLLNIFLIFFVTLSVFPAVHSDIKRSTAEFPISDEYFTLITCFLTFNLFAMLGSLTTSWVQWPKPKYLVVPVVLRIAFIPLFLFCNYLPKAVIRTLPVYITSDWIYWIIGISMSFTSGYLSSLGMMYAPKNVNPKYQVTAGMFASAMLITGIFAGVMFGFVCPLLVQ